MTANMAASVHQLLLNLSRSEGRPFNDVLQHYALERWLYRLSTSPHSGRLILKGALMLTVWEIPFGRPTRDIDLLARMSNDLSSIAGVVRDICTTPVQNDGLEFDHRSIVAVSIAEDADYTGVRATFTGRLGNAKVSMQIDMGFSDVITPGPTEIEYPTLLGMPPPLLAAYNRETSIAEKFEAMIKLGELNSRVKDFFDIWTLARSQSFDGASLAAAVRGTFERRGTEVDIEAVCFDPGFPLTDSKRAQWAAFVRRGQLEGAPTNFADVWELVVQFLRPVAEAAGGAADFGAAQWPAGGPWA